MSIVGAIRRILGRAPHGGEPAGPVDGSRQPAGSGAHPRAWDVDDLAPPPEKDPKEIITETAFRVDRELLGVPLAHPGRRLVAMLVDLAAVGLLVLLKEISGALFAIGLGWVAWRVGSLETQVRIRRTWLRRLVRLAGAATVVLGALTLLGPIVSGLAGGLSRLTGGPPPTEAERQRERVERRQEATEDVQDLLEGGLERFGLPEVAGLTRDILQLARVPGPDSARAVGSRVAGALYTTGATREEIRRTLVETLENASDAGDWPEDSVAAIAEAAMAGVDSLAARRRRGDSLLAVYAEAVRNGDSARADSLVAWVAEAYGEGAEARYRSRLGELRAQLREARETPGVVAWARATADDLGLSLGWLGFYFVAFVALWRGHTPGKRLLGIRIVKVTGRPLTWWDAFGRFGGYAAGIATGLVGFAQILWDPNRQGVHDRIAGTVVVREKGLPPGWAPAEPKVEGGRPPGAGTPRTSPAPGDGEPTAPPGAGPDGSRSG